MLILSLFIFIDHHHFSSSFFFFLFFSLVYINSKLSRERKYRVRVSYIEYIFRNVTDTRVFTIIGYVMLSH